MAALGRLGIALFVTLALFNGGAAQPNAAMGRVINMLTNLVNMIETEGEADDEHTAEFQGWCNSEIKTNTHVVEGEQRRIEETTAVLSDLRAQKTKLDDVVGGLNQQITDETSQLNQATQRRDEEHTSYTSEMQNFNNAISACDKAVTMLKAHYGDGTPHEAKKPEFMSLLSTYISTAHTLASKLGVKARGKANPYQESTGEGLNIVDQVAELRSSFAEDQQTSQEEEGRLQGLYDNLAKQKNELISSLTTERDTQQAQLNQINKEIAENETVLSMAQELLADRQAYLATIKTQLETQTTAYNTRKADRKAESVAISQAVKVLQSKSFVQLDATVMTMSQQTKLKEILRHQAKLDSRFADAAERVARDVSQRGSLRVGRSHSYSSCPQCHKAASLLKSQAKLLHSSILAMAAATSMGNEALSDVIRSLDEMIRQLGRDQDTESEHKDWCEKEMSLTTNRKMEHTYSVATIEQNVADLGEVISMKQTSLKENAQDISSAQAAFGQLTTIRNSQHEEFEDDVQDHQDAIGAMNEAVNILAEFYASRNKQALDSRQSGSPEIPDAASLLQTSMHLTQPASGSRTVKMMTGVREEFEAAVVSLNDNEAKAKVAYNKAKEEYTQTDNDLAKDKDTMMVELQTAQQSLVTNKRDHETHNGEIRAAENYMSQLNRSCGPLLKNYDNRKKLRQEEKKAIEEAQTVLREVA